MKQILAVVLIVVISLLVSPSLAATPNSSMVALLHFNWSPGSGNFTDEYGSQWSPLGSGGGWLTYINTSTSAGGYKFGNGSAWFHGTTDANAVSTANRTERVWGDNHTIEFWYYPISTSGLQALYWQGGSYSAVQLGYDGTNKRLVLYSSTTGSTWDVASAYTTPSNMVPLGQWSHIEVDWNKPYLKVYVNGILNATRNSTGGSLATKTANVTIGFTGGSNLFGGIDEFAEWNITLHMANFTPPSSEYLPSAPVGTPILANFTQSPNPSYQDADVTFNDTSTGTPTTWNWTFGDGNTSTDQHPVYAFPDVGSYWVDLNVTNSTGSFSNYTALHTVTNVSGFTPQDVWMEGQYNRTFHFTSSSDGTPLAANYITSDGQSGTASTLGYAFVTEAFGVYTITVSMTDYATRTVSFVVDEDGTTEIQLTPASAVVKNQNVWYTPHQVRLSIVDTSNAKIVNAQVNATAIANTFPDDASSNWLEDLYGIQPDVANDMMNGTLIMDGTTGGDGATVFSMHSSIMYNIQITNPANGVTHSTNITPIDEMYLITIAGAAAANNTYEDMGYNQTLWIYEPNTSYVTMNLSFQDMSGRTNLVIFYVNHLPNNTLLYSSAVTSPGTSEVKMNYTVKNTRPNRYVYGYWANRTV